MPTVEVYLEGDNCWPDLLDRQILIAEEPIQIAILSEGMKSGRPSVTFRIDMPDGRSVLAETSLRLLLTAIRLIEAKYGEFIE